jgi:hypothetical protein
MCRLLLAAQWDVHDTQLSAFCPVAVSVSYDQQGFFNRSSLTALHLIHNRLQGPVSGSSLHQFTF